MCVFYEFVYIGIKYITILEMFKQLYKRGKISTIRIQELSKELFQPFYHQVYRMIYYIYHWLDKKP